MSSQERHPYQKENYRKSQEEHPTGTSERRQNAEVHQSFYTNPDRALNSNAFSYEENMEEIMDIPFTFQQFRPCSFMKNVNDESHHLLRQNRPQEQCDIAHRTSKLSQQDYKNLYPHFFNHFVKFTQKKYQPQKKDDKKWNDIKKNLENKNRKKPSNYVDLKRKLEYKDGDQVENLAFTYLKKQYLQEIQSIPKKVRRQMYLNFREELLQLMKKRENTIQQIENLSESQIKIQLVKNQQLQLMFVSEEENLQNFNIPKLSSLLSSGSEKQRKLLQNSFSQVSESSSDLLIKRRNS